MKSEKEICLSILQILEQQFGISRELFGENYEEVRLTSKAIGLTGLDLVYLLFEIEKGYGIRISADSLDNHGFDSVQGIARAVLLAGEKSNCH
ncbi:MAG: acyl carrier protein [Ruminococcus flavefaciens]|nr:acyl carrier protein [Roseburia sp.]MCM1234454.1 acyl carrier protein [Ruminococcus flavefaciens]